MKKNNIFHVFQLKDQMSILPELQLVSLLNMLMQVNLHRKYLRFTLSTECLVSVRKNLINKPTCLIS